MIMTNLQIYYLKNFKLTVKITAKVIMRMRVCTITKTQKMILDTNLKLIKDGNISAKYIRKTTVRLSGKQEPYLFVLSNINNK